MTKTPFDINIAIRRIRKAVEPFPKAAMFQLYEEGYTSAFEQLVACIISIRTYDEVTIPTAKRLFALARTPEQIARLTPQEIDAAIHACTSGRRACVPDLIAAIKAAGYNQSRPLNSEKNRLGMDCTGASKAGRHHYLT